MENTIAVPSSAPLRSPWGLRAALAAVSLLLALAIWIAASNLAGAWLQNRQDRAIAAFEEQTGIRVLRLVRTAGGGIIDFQYQVVDPDKALIVHDADNPPMMIDQAHNLIFANPFHEHASRELHTAVTYHEMIMNGGGLLQAGSKVTLRVGEAVLQGLVVR